jgi:ABC-type Fe3+ transport system substrate-binding protein
MFMPLRSARLLLAAALAAIVGWTSTSAAADWNELISSAKKEGKVVVYASTFGNAQYKSLVRSFETKYGISVDTLDIRASEMFERVRVEQAAGRFIADLILQPVSVVTVIQRAGLLQKHGNVPNTKNLRPEILQALGNDGYRIPLYTAFYGILVNGNVPPSEEPKSWHDLLAPKWKGQIILDDPRAIGNGFALFNATYKGLGPEFQAMLAQQEPIISRQVRNDERRVARGEYPLYAPHSFPFFIELKGKLPLRFVFPKEGSPNADTQAVVAKDAPHVNAAHLFINHILDAESQLAYGNAGLMPAVAGVDDKLSADVQEMLQVKRLPQVDLDDMQELMGKAKELYK